MASNDGPRDNGPAADVEALAAAGRHAEAAEAALNLGQHTRAGELFELVWTFGRAARAFRDAGDLGRALKNACEARDEPLVGEIAAALTASDDGARIALEVFTRQRRHPEAAPLAERLGEIEKAIALYQRAHRDLDAARLLEAAGRDREAGRLLEKVVDLADGPDRAEAHLRLGRILARRSSHEPAARHLQEAARHGPTRPAALRHLVVALAAMGLRDAARDALVELRRLEPALSPDLDAFLREARDAEPRPATTDREVIGGRYRLDRLVGAGSAGRVFRAIDEVTGRTVAIKMLHAASSRGASYERFLREARIASALRHPAIVEVYDFSAEQSFLVMEYLAGGSLATRLSNGETFGAPQVRRFALELLGGLELAHHRGVVHRDVKPANVFFDSRGAAKLGDFGVAHLIDLGQTQTGGLIGTLAYMSPEQITGAPITIGADLYSLGITLFEALTGRMPFLGPDFVAQHLGAPAPSPREIAPGLAPAWDVMLLRLLRKSPSERHTSIAELRAELEQLELGESGPAVVLPRPRRDTRPHSIAELAAEDEPPAAEKGPRYQFETPIGSTAISHLVRAVDTVLGRSVVIERFLDDVAADPAIARIRKLASANSPFVQRALSYDRERRTAVFEAPAGAPIQEVVRGDLDPTDAVRLVKRLARAAASLHELGGAHGAIGPATVVLDDIRIPTVLASGLGPVTGAADPLADVAAIVALAAAACGAAEPTLPSLLATLAPAMPASERAALAAESPADGEALYALADRVEIAMIRSRRAS